MRRRSCAEPSRSGWKRCWSTAPSTATSTPATSGCSAFKDVGAFPEDVGTDDEVGARLEMVMGPLLDQGLSEVSIGAVLKIFIDMMEQYSGGAGAPKELLLLMKQMLYLERYSKALAPD